MRTFDFSPLYRSAIGIDRFANLLDESLRADTPSYPPYNIELQGENQYRITMAVAGFAENELEIEVKGDALLVTGRKDAPFTFRRRFERVEGGWRVRDQLRPDEGWADIAGGGISGFQTSTTTIMARVWSPDQAQPWHDLTAEIAALEGGETLLVDRTFGADR